MVKEITSKELKKLLDENKVTLIDVRPSDAYKKGHIPTALSAPMDTPTLCDSLQLVSGSRTTVLYCFIGISSRKACQALIDLSKDSDLNIYSLKKGIEEWIRNNYPISI